MKHFFTILTVLSISISHAQIYVGADIGANWSYNSVSGDKAMIKSTPEVSVTGGIKAGYNLPDLMQFETGIYYNNYKVGFKFTNPSVRFTHTALSTFQIPLRVKPLIYNNRPMKIFATVGAIPTFIGSTQSNTPWDSTIVADGTGDTLILNSTANYNLKKSFIAFELGIALEYEMKDNLMFTANVMAQTSLSDIMKTDLYYSRNGGATSTTQLTSSGFSTFFEVGIAYYIKP